MFWFGKRQVIDPRVDALQIEVNKIASALRLLEVEQQTVHDQVRRWMRRAVAAERNQGALEDPAASSPESTPARPRILTGVRARRLARAMRPDPLLEVEDNGVHP